MTASNSCYSGWDIGGAHLKVCRCDANGNIINSLELVCPLWHGLTGLRQTLEQALSLLSNQQDQHFITLTGESADCFANRQQGVCDILTTVSEFLTDKHCHVFSQSQHWLTLAEAQHHWQQVASMNWLATASWLARIQSEALLIDIGSTTSDIIAIRHSQPRLKAFDDIGRLQSGELVYSGVIRTPLMALAQVIPFAGQQQRVANEVFATTADIWRLLNQLPSEISDHSADGKSWQLKDCRQRLARMVGTDAQHYPESDWQQLAGWYAEQQVQQLLESSRQAMDNHALPANAPVIGAGAGRFLAAILAEKLTRPYQDLADLTNNGQAAITAPASALALLGWQQFK